MKQTFPRSPLTHAAAACHLHSASIRYPDLHYFDAWLTSQTVLSSQGLLGDLKRALAQRMLNTELDVHLDQDQERQAGNHRNGSSSKTVLTEDGPIELSIPRDRHGHFDPALIRKYQRRFPGFDQKIIALYARGMSTRDIQAHVAELYGIDISPDLVSAVTDSVIEEAQAWQARPLDPTYAVVYFDALRVKIRDEGLVRNKAVYLAIGVSCEGYKDVLGIWVEQTEGAKFWLKVMNELKLRGIQDILIAVVDGLKGFPDAIISIFPQTVVQTCIVHLIRNSVQFATWKDRHPLASALRPIYAAADVQAAQQELDRFETGSWHERYPTIVPMWRRHWAEVIPSSPSARQCASLSTPPTLSKACIVACASPSATKDTSLLTKQPSN